MKNSATQILMPASGEVLSPSRNRGLAGQPTQPRHESIDPPAPGLGRRAAIFAYGLVCYAIFFATFLYAFGFVGNVFTPTSLDKLPDERYSMHWVAAVAVNMGLLLVFAVQHSVMARPWFKARWTRIVPEAAERSTYVLLSSLALIAMFVMWQPIGGLVWDMEHPIGRMALYGLMACGWLLVLWATFLINHFDLFGLRQVWLYLFNVPYTYPPFATPGLYSRVRHPLYVGWFIAFWATPTMTAAHLLFAVVTTVYMIVAIRWEESDLVSAHGERYAEYRDRVPKLIPSLRPVSVAETRMGSTVSHASAR